MPREHETFREYASDLLGQVYEGLITESDMLHKLNLVAAGSIAWVDKPEVVPVED